MTTTTTTADLQWKRENDMWVAQAPEGRYQIEGRSGHYVVWYYGNDRHVAQPNTRLAGDLYYLDNAKQYAKEDFAKRTHPAAYASAALKLIAAAQEQLQLATASSQSLATAGILQTAIDEIGVTRDSILRAKKKALGEVGPDESDS